MSKVVVLGSWARSLLNFRGHLLAEMVKAGYEVHAIAPEADKEIVDALRKMDVTYHDISLSRIGMNPLRDIMSLVNLYRLFRHIQPDYLLTYTIKPVIYGAIAARMAGVRNIFAMITGVGYTFSDKSAKGKVVSLIARSLFRLSLRHNKHVFFQNRDNLRIFQEYGLIRRQNQPVLINGSGVDLEYFSPMPLPSGISFLMISRLLHDKGVYEYIAAARQLKANYPELKFSLAGWIDENPNAISQEELEEWVRDGVVDYLGYMDDVRPAISNTSVYVLPSYHEGMPRTVLEAMAMGRPIITTDIPGCRDAVLDGDNGFLVQVGDAAALSGAMLRYVNDPDLVPAMGEASLRYAREKFDVHEVNRDILATMGLRCETSI